MHLLYSHHVCINKVTINIYFLVADATLCQEILKGSKEQLIQIKTAFHSWNIYKLISADASNFWNAILYNFE